MRGVPVIYIGQLDMKGVPVTYIDHLSNSNFKGLFNENITK
jgi:hypothetical protein